MKNYIVKALRDFIDGTEDKPRRTGDEFNVTKERYEFLNSKNAVELVNVIEEIIKEEKPKKKNNKKK